MSEPSRSPRYDYSMVDSREKALRLVELGHLRDADGVYRNAAAEFGGVARRCRDDDCLKSAWRRGLSLFTGLLRPTQRCRQNHGRRRDPSTDSVHTIPLGFIRDESRIRAGIDVLLSACGGSLDPNPEVMQPFA